MSEESKQALSDEELQVIVSYLLFSNGPGHIVLEDLKAVFRDFRNDVFNEELAEIPHPYREYVKHGCRLVVERIQDTMKYAEEIQ
jgi:hypothetical protein